MGKLVVCMNLTVDGVMQGPAKPDEDRRDGFTQGGWGAGYDAMAHAGPTFGNASALLVGRRTYERFHEVWGKRDTQFTPWMNNIRKYVVSTTLREPLPWINSVLVNGDLRNAIASIQREVEKDVLILGSGELIRSLIREHIVIDEWVLLIHPLILGSGRRLFPDNGARTALSLVSSSTTPTGVVVATYHPS